jgi:gluconate 2-dehydrogenase gamma chain
MDRRDALRLIGTAAAIPVFAGMSAERLWAIAADAHGRSGSVRGRVLDAHQLDTVATIAEYILPRTDTPGARDAGVPGFVDLLLAEWYDEQERTELLQGLAAIDASSRAAGGKDFIALAAAGQIAVLQALDGAAARPPASAEAAYATLKGLTIYGYFTSRPVMTTVLKSVIWPGRYHGCVPA